MDRRMYRGNSGRDCGCGKNTGSRHSDPVCGDPCAARMHEDMCDRHDQMCEREGDFDRFPIAMCYVPWQCFRNIYENEYEALENGTLFKELDLNWYGRGCK